MTTFLSSFALCLDTQGEIFSYLSTREYGVMRQLSMEMCETTIIDQCVRSYRLHGILSYERLVNRVPLNHIEYLCIECKNVVIPSSDLWFPRLCKLKFYAMYSLYTIFFDWDRFFSQIRCPALAHIEWQNVPFPFEEMSMILKKYGLGNRLKEVVVPQDTFHHLEYSPESYNQAIIEFYKECPNLETLRLDMDNKSMDYMYIPLFIPPTQFTNLRTLQLVNRSKTLVDTICNDGLCLPLLQHLELLWVYDSNPLFPTVEMMHTSASTSMSMPLVVRKPSLQKLRISYYSWHHTSLHSSKPSCPLQCYLTLETDQSVHLVLSHVTVRIIQSTFPPSY